MSRDGAVSMLGWRGVERTPDEIVAQTLEMADATRRVLIDTGVALLTTDPDRTRAVATATGRIGLTHIALERDIVDLIVRRPPIAGDLRRLVALLHTGTHLERMAGTGIALARLALEPDARAVPPALARRLVVMATRVGQMLDDAVRPWHGPSRDMRSTPVHLARQVEEVHATLVGALVAAAKEGLPLAPILWVDHAIGLLHEAGQLAVNIAETAHLAPPLPHPSQPPTCVPVAER